MTVGVALAGFGTWLPDAWYTPLPGAAPLPALPIRGIALLQLSFVLEGVLLVGLGVLGWRFQRLPEAARLHLPASAQPDDGLSRGRARWLLAAITLLALGLRLYGLNSDLWIDEIAPLVAYGHASPWQILITYGGSNNHLLNSLLVSLFVAALGEHEWVVRLPAVLFGVATIPVLYAVARQVLSRRSSLAAALLLAVSYHHIFFSQNARGYSAYLFFSLASAAMLVLALRGDRARDWALFSIASVCNVASQLIGVFAFAAHGLIAGLAWVEVARRRGPALALAGRLLLVFGVTALLVFQVYAAVLPQMIAVMRTVYADPAAGYAPLSAEFFLELLRGIAAGYSPGVLALAAPFLAVAGMAACAGFVTLLRRNWALMLALSLPLVVHMLFLIVQNLVFSPRFFLLGLPLALIAAVQGIDDLVAWLVRLARRPDVLAPRLATALVLLLGVASLLSLTTYYSVPKQPYSSSLAYVESIRRPGDVVLVIHLAEAGYRYYGREFNIAEGSDYFYVRSLDAFESVLGAHPNGRPLLVTTFARALYIDYPDLYARIDRDWTRLRTFPATIGDGEIAVWVKRSS